jgi:hypothetical protein
MQQPAQHEPARNGMKRSRGKLMVPGEPHIVTYVSASADAVQRLARHGEQRTATVLSRCQNLQDNEQLV